MLPLLRGYEPDRTILFDRGRPVNAAAFCGMATAISARLPAARFAFNLCEGSAAFLLATAAALLARQTLVLPPSRLERTLDELLAAYPDSYCLVDAPPTAPRPSDAKCFALCPELDAARTSPPPDVFPPPMIPAAHAVAILFTSGSTGAPQPHAKSWGEMCEGTQTLLRSFGTPPRGAVLLGTVPPQHMFGFETTVMLALQSGTPLFDARPLYPADLAHALDAAAACGVSEVWLMSTPLQLRAFHRELREARGVRRVITATMPLDPDLARDIERDWNVAVEEIFGCTEGGILATRRPATTRYFTPAAGLVFAVAADDSVRVSGGHLPQPLALSDRLQPESAAFADGGRFEVIGRGEDMVKVAGKRASLQALNRELLAVPGVIDGVLFLPAEDASRLAAIVVAPGRGALDIRSCLAGRIDAAFMPRPLVLAPVLPRDANGKLPAAGLQALLRASPAPDASENPGGVETFVGEATIAADHPALPGHFPGNPIVPGVVLLELVEALLAGHGYRVRECAQVKFLSPVFPLDRLALRVEVTERASARFAVTVADASAMVGRFACEPVAADG